MVSPYEKRQVKQLLCKLEEMELAVTDIVDLKSIFSEGGFCNSGANKAMETFKLLLF